jgi:hypothetical protein
MTEKRIQFNTIVKNQFPKYIEEEFPLAQEFFTQYYIAQEGFGGPLDLIQNIDKYTKLGVIAESFEESTLVQTSSPVGFFDTTITVENTRGFPESYGLIKINDEIIAYKSKTIISFNECIRGFSGITSYRDPSAPEELIFSISESEEHIGGSRVENLSALLYNTFFKKIKKQIAPGFEDRSLFSGKNDDQTSIEINKENFIQKVKDFYGTKGTDESFKILFKALYNENVDIIKPKDYLFKPSDANYTITKDLIVSAIEGDPTNLVNSTLYQDQYHDINLAYAPVAKVEKVSTGIQTSNYYKVSIDANYDRDIIVKGALYGDFTAHPHTKCIGNISAGSSYLDADSTVGFSDNGELTVVYTDGSVGVISYSSKNLSQFIGCSNIEKVVADKSDIVVNTYAYGYSNKNDGEIIKVRIAPVLESLVFDNANYYYSSGDTVDIQSLGKKGTFGDLTNRWFINACSTYEIENISIIDSTDNTVSIKTFDSHSLIVGDEIILSSTLGLTNKATIVNITSSKSFIIKGQGSVDPNLKYTLTKVLTKTSALYFKSSSYINSNVQNVYVDGEKTLISSASIPNYYNQSLEVNDKSIIFGGTYPPVGFGSTDTFNISPFRDHGLYTGDEVYYSYPKKVSFNEDYGYDQVEILNGNLGDNFPEGLLFVTRVDENNVKFSRSKSNIFNKIFLSVDAPVTFSENKLEIYKFAGKTLESQKLLREISPPKISNGKYETMPGKTGILINGVEVLNYKGSNTIYYGPLRSVDVTSPGDDYDIINPPILHISDSVGYGATGYVSVIGSLSQIKIIDPGYNYIDDPILKIEGGNGFGASTQITTKLITNSPTFNANRNAELIGIGTSISTIGFTTYHRLLDGEKVIYRTNGKDGILGLVTNSYYHVSVEDEYTVKLYNTESDAIVGTGTIALLSYGKGIHTLESVQKKKVIGNIIVTNPGSGYQNKKRTSNTLGISTSSNSVTINDHGFETGEIVKYYVDGAPILGLSTNNRYYVKKIDSNSFRLSSLVVNSDGSYYDSNEFVNFENVGFGTHIFNYPEITAEILGKIGISSLPENDFKAVIRPIFRGSVESVHLSNNGIGYGSSEVLNFYRDPLFKLYTGSGAQVTAIVSQGSIVEVLVNSKGSSYNSSPTLEIIGSGTGAVISPIIENGELVAVNVLEGGIGYTADATFINIISSGSGANFVGKITPWTINVFERDSQLLTRDDGFITNGLNEDYGLQYTHIYAPRKLRESIYSSNRNGEILYGESDLKKFSGSEVDSENHSPIIGWAYDGNPIYGPYGYSTGDGGIVSQLKSGYKLKISNDRPPFPEGFFVEDYVYYRSEDPLVLDENNGRFCITPEFPNGVYAYFATFNRTPDSSGAFRGYKRPVFPYLIGNYYRSIPNQFNFKKSSNQDTIDLNDSQWIRSTYKHNILNEHSYYEYAYTPNNLTQKSNIKYASPGSIDTVGIVTGGNNYKINDSLILNEEGTFGYGANITVSSLLGRKVNNISVSSSSISNVEAYPIDGNGNFIFFSKDPHNFNNSDILSISGVNTTTSLLEGSFRAGVSSDRYILSVGVDAVDPMLDNRITYFRLLGNLAFPNLRENDLLGIGTEVVKVLNIEEKDSRIRVLRAVNNVSSAHSSTTFLYKKQRSFKVNVGYKTTYNCTLNKELYFNPLESIVLGVGIGTLVFSNPGSGSSSIAIPPQSIYLPGHGLKTGDIVSYNTYGGSPIGVSTNGISTNFAISDQSILYVAKISENLIGISTIKVGMGSTGTFVGVTSENKNKSILYFIGIGTGKYHSFKTNFDNVLNSNVQRNSVTVGLAETHGLANGDNVYINVIVGTSVTFKVKYNDNHRRLTLNERSFSGINTSRGSITILNHGYYTGERVIHNSPSNTSTFGPENNQICYVVVVDDNNIKLSTTYKNSIARIPSYIGISSVYSGTLSQINPPLKVYKNSKVIFDLSDSSLAFTQQSIQYSAFDFNLYSDIEFINPFNSSKSSGIFELKKYGTIGITNNARVELTLNDSFHNTLYYKLDPINQIFSPKEKQEILVDEFTDSHNQIQILESLYNGKHEVVVSSASSFKYTIPKLPESSTYSSGISSISYTTDSLNAYGPISNMYIKNGGRNYYSLPSVSNLSSDFGSNAIISLASNTIGKIKNSKIIEIGYDYPTDFTLRPTSKLPQVCKVDPLSSLQTVSVVSFGRGYTSVPKLIILDGKTKNIVPEVDLRFEFGNTNVEIVRNTFGIYNTNPIIIPTNNSNGVGISTLVFNSTNKTVTAVLSVGFSTAESFPFEIGDKIFVENINVGSATTVRGYNSSNYGYELFEVLSVAKNIGGVGIITYSMAEYLDNNQYPGIYDPKNSAGRLIPEKYFPKFDVTLKQNNFIKNERVVFEGGKGTVESWDKKSSQLKIRSMQTVLPTQIIEGLSSLTKGEVGKVDYFDSFYKINYFSKVESGWETETGFLNNNLQRIQDNEYYQNFSYSLKSRVYYDTWNDPVSTLNHTVGFAKFSDLQIESELPLSAKSTMAVSLPAPKDIPGVEIIVDLIGVADLNCVYDFDLVTENSLKIGSSVFSNEILFKNRIISDYSESTGNRVLIIDDISGEFNSNPRASRYDEVSRFRLSDGRVKKFITYVKDKRYFQERQLMLITLLYDNNNNAYISQYGRVETISDLGSFDFTVSGLEGVLNFYPTKYEVNDYDISSLSYNIKGVFSSVGSTSFGDIATIVGTSKSDVTSTILDLPIYYNSVKGLVEITGHNGEYEFTEFNLVHNGINVEFVEYGQMTNHSFDEYSSPGLGTFHPYISGSNLKVDFISNLGLSTTGFGATVNTIQVAIANTTFTGIGTFDLRFGQIHTNVTSIAATSSPVATVVDHYEDVYNGGYYLIQVSDLSNGETQLSELIVIDDDTTSYDSEFGNVETGGSLGIVGTAKTDNITKITFTPNPDIDVEVRVFANILRDENDAGENLTIDLSNSSVETDYGTYTGTQNNIRRNFDLKHKTIPIFRREFDGSSSTIVDVSSNSIIVPDHFFVTGEQVLYRVAGSGTSNAIGIASTSFTGIGVTDKLPENVYVIKLNESSIKLARTAGDALLFVPKEIEITSIGIGTSHSLTSINQNSKVIVAIDNAMQSPLVSTAITSSLSKELNTTDNIAYFTGITSFFGTDLIKIDQEIMRIESIGVGDTFAVRVRRPWMGTPLSGHSTDARITKVVGNYNIVDNTINFAAAPYGNTPLSSTTNQPSERDWTGITTGSKFQGRSFIRSGIRGSSEEAYAKNYIFDDISSQFNGQSKQFTLTSLGSSVSGIQTSNAIVLIDGIFQGPGLSYDYNLAEYQGITSVRFTGSASSISYDPNNASIPVGGVIVSVGSIEGSGYQPLVSAGGTAVVSIAGTISSISIGNSGSGYRRNQTVRVGVSTSSTGIPNIQFIGTAAVSNGNIVSIAVTNSGIGYTRTNPPQVLIDDPLSYSNIPLIYSVDSTIGLGTQATIDIVVGQGSSVIDFEIKNFGYGYGQGETLTVPIGGLSGIPTTSDFLQNTEFQISIQKIVSNKFTGWTIGELQVLDNLDNLFDSESKSFQLTLAGNIVSIRSYRGSPIDVQATLLVFINDVLQVPGEGYIFNGGSILSFTEAPKPGDKSKIIFYKGSGSVDVVDRDILETVKIGDEFTIGYDPSIGQPVTYQEDERTVTTIKSVDLVATNPYFGPGNSSDDALVRPVTWCRQTEDKIINEKEVAKDRDLYESLVYPTSYIIQSIGAGSTIIYVDTLRTLFDAYNENNTNLSFQEKITIISQNSLVGASATAVVSSGGTITSIIISKGGSGYTTSPTVNIGSPIGFGTTQRASASSIISIDGSVSTITINSPGFGYTTTPPVLIEPPASKIEVSEVTSYSGDYGVIVGLGVTTVSFSTKVIFDLFITPGSEFRDSSLVDAPITVSGISTGDYFVVSDTQIGSANTSISSRRSDNTIVAIGTNYLDNIYQVEDFDIISKQVIGIGTTSVSRVYARVSGLGTIGLTGIGFSNVAISSVTFDSTAITFDSTLYTFDSSGSSSGLAYTGTILNSNYFGKYAWGKIVLSGRYESNEFDSYTSRGLSGITTSARVIRYSPLKYKNYKN